MYEDILTSFIEMKKRVINLRDFEIIRPLGYGGFSTVFQGIKLQKDFMTI